MVTKSRISMVTSKTDLTKVVYITSPSVESHTFPTAIIPSDCYLNVDADHILDDVGPL